MASLTLAAVCPAIAAPGPLPAVTHAVAIELVRKSPERDLLVHLRLTAASAGRPVAIAVLTLAFLPWTLAEAKRADEAARLRGSDPRRRPLRHLAAMTLPVSVRTLEKARRGAEALTLRDSAYGD